MLVEEEYKERKKRLFSIYIFYQFMVNFQYSYLSCQSGVSPSSGKCGDLFLTDYDTVKKKKVPFLASQTNFDIYMNVTKTDNLSNVLASAQIKCDSSVSTNTSSNYFRMEKNDNNSDNIANFTCNFKESSCLYCWP